MKINKKTSILSGLLLLAIIIAIHGKYQEQRLRNELKKAISDTYIKDSIIKNSLPNIDSLLIKGDYENALTAYQEQFETIHDNHKEVVQFRIDIANHFIDLNKKQNQKDSSTLTKKGKNHRVNPKKEHYQAQHNNTLVTELKTTKNQTTRQIQNSNNAYLTFKSTKKNELHYVGTVINGKANGYGIAVFDSGGRYEGEWKNNVRDGYGSFYWTDGQYYEGEYVDDLRDGYGTYSWPNGEKYIGLWKKDKRHGEGTFYYKNGKVVKGIWKKDKLTEEQK